MTNNILGQEEPVWWWWLVVNDCYHSPPTQHSKNLYALKPVPPAPRPIRPVHNLTLEIIDTASTQYKVPTLPSELAPSFLGQDFYAVLKHISNHEVMFWILSQFLKWCLTIQAHMKAPIWELIVFPKFKPWSAACQANGIPIIVQLFHLIFDQFISR